MKTKYFALAIFIVLSFQSCLKEDIFIEENLETVSKDTLSAVKETRLLKNPYEITTFRKAYQKVLENMADSTIKTGKGFRFSKEVQDTANIAPNYVYVRFDPQDSIQEAKLTTHPDIIVLDYPFEYDEPEDFTSRIRLKKGEVLSYWASLSTDQGIPKVPHEILQEMYIPEKDPKYADDGKSSNKNTERGKVNDKMDFMNHVLEEAYTATGNEDLLPEPSQLKKGESCETCLLGINLRRRWRPSGNVKIWDDQIGRTTTSRRVFSHYESYRCTDLERVDVNGNRLAANPARCRRAVYRTVTTTVPGSYVPIDGANILIRDTWTLDRAIADSRGNFRHKRVRAKVRYVIKWDRFEFSIRDNSGLTQAEDKGPKLYNRPWNLRIRSGRMKYRGQIFQAAMHFYYHNIGGLSRPPTNGFWHVQMKIAAKETTGTSSHKHQFRAGGILPVIKIKQYGRSSEKVYGITIHELAHAAHWRFDKNAYNKLVHDGWFGPWISNGSVNYPGPTGSSARRTLESWARAVEIYLTTMRYKRLGNASYSYIPGTLGPAHARVTMGNYQWQEINNNNNDRFYTSAIWDMHDTFNQRVDYGLTYSTRPMDRVSGISMPQLQNAMRGSISWNGLRNKVISLYGRRATVTELFANWNGL